MSNKPFRPRLQSDFESEQPKFDRTLKVSVEQNEKTGLLEKVSRLEDSDPVEEMRKYRFSDFSLDQISLAGGLSLLRRIPSISGSPADIADHLSDSFRQLDVAVRDYNRKIQLEKTTQIIDSETPKTE